MKKIFNLYSLFGFILCSSPQTVFAHLVNTEVGEFYAGMIHPLTSFEHILPMIALMLFSSQADKKAGRIAMFVFPLVLIIGMFSGKNLTPSGLIHLSNILILILLGLVLVFVRKIVQMGHGFILAIAFTTVVAFILGYRSGVDMANAQVSIQFIPGVALTGFVFFALSAAWIAQSPGGLWDHLRTFGGMLFCGAGFFMLWQFLSGNTLAMPQGIGLPTEESIKSMMVQKEFTITFITGSLLASILWGAGHALTPGHGKAIVGAYLVGAHSSPWHAIYLGLTVTITHTLGVFLLGFIAVFASRYILPEDLYPYLGAVSGSIVLILGASMIWSRIKNSHGHHHHHGQEHSHHHHHGHSHQHSHHHHLPPGANGSSITWKSLLGLGISGGLIPCPSALVLLLTAVSLNRPEFGMVLVIFFSLGLAGVLTIVGLLFVKGSRMLKEKSRFEKIARYIPTASAFIILIIGIVITYESINPLIFN